MSEATNIEDRRKSKRYPLKVVVKIGTESPEYPVYIMNISPDGVCLYSPTIFPVGTELIIRIIDESAGDSNKDITGEVVWSTEEEEYSFMGIKFKKSSKELLKEYINVAD